MTTHAQLAGALPQPPAPRRRLQLATRRMLPWERLALGPVVPAPVERSASVLERRRREELARQFSALPAELVLRLLREEVDDAPAQIRQAVLVRQLDETAPAKRGALLAMHLRGRGASLFPLLAPLDVGAWLADGSPEDARLTALLTRLGVHPGAWPQPATLEVVGQPATRDERLCEGHRGVAVERMQRRLCELGYLSQAVATQHAGDFERQTLGALRAFQADHRLPVTGALGAHTHRALSTTRFAH